MLMHTHLLLAKKLLAKINDNDNLVNINRFAFYWGSIRPDIHTPFSRGTHMFEISSEKIGKIWGCAENLSMFDGFWSSYYLGYVMHYIADYFTFVHNDKKSISELKSHIAYERKLHAQMKDVKSSNFECIFTGNFNQYLTELREEYFYGDSSIERDCMFIWNCTYALTEWAASPVVTEKKVLVSQKFVTPTLHNS